MGDEAADVSWSQITQASNTIPTLNCVSWEEFEQLRGRSRYTCQEYQSAADLGGGLARWPEGWSDDAGGRSKSGQRIRRQEGLELQTKLK